MTAEDVVMVVIDMLGGDATARKLFVDMCVDVGMLPPADSCLYMGYMEPGTPVVESIENIGVIRFGSELERRAYENGFYAGVEHFVDASVGEGVLTGHTQAEVVSEMLKHVPGYFTPVEEGGIANDATNVDDAANHRPGVGL